ncbi:cupin domain-containing protein [Pseudozobellia thermophila]|uniref:Cupin domain protein n=1 Tax=Pseudozobellia thermophila TaxID=192903 RepID=A0A1M6GL48_9FLAO|nr:cupin domain-containing protein [Pseudozobellia thermophila]SHJ10681.1 Cupin domain protein [Pseudozobellia thermophila]
MKLLERPELTPLQMGGSMKIIQIEGRAGMRMPPHYSSQEAVLLVQQGLALLGMPDSEHKLRPGDTFIIPAKKEHTLIIKQDFKALAIMGLKSEINFI